jgi:hypothetical protein
MRETWSSEELPVLVAIRQAELDGSVNCTVDDLLGRDGVDRASLPFLLDRLHEAGFIVANRIGSAFVYPPYFDRIRLTGSGREAIGQWPSPHDPFNDLVDSIRGQIEAETNPEAKRKLQRFLDAMTDVGSGVISSILSGVLKAHGVPTS